MKLNLLFGLAGGLSFLLNPELVRAQTQSPFVYESPREAYASADFDGDGRQDVVIVDKETGKLRIGYQAKPGMFSWVDNRPSGVKGVAGVTVGKLFGKTDALAVASPDANQITLVDISSITAPGRPVNVPFEDALGPSTLVAIDIGGAGNGPDLDFYVGSIYNSPDPNQATLLRTSGAEHSKLLDVPLSGAPARGNRVAIKAGQPDALALLIRGEQADTFQLQDLSKDKPAILAKADLPKGSDYAIGAFTSPGALDFLFYKPGDKQLEVRTLKETGGKYELSQGASLDLGQPIRRVITLKQPAGERLFVVFGEGEKAGLYQFDGKQAPVSLHTLASTNDLFTAAASLDDGFVAFSQPVSGKFSTRYQVFKVSGDAYAVSIFGGLVTLADNDNITIPDIHKRIAAGTQAATEAEMALFTNTIPGTRVSFVMVPIKGGEFVMGSPESEKDRKPDEGPQHKVKVSPFLDGAL